MKNLKDYLEKNLFQNLRDDETLDEGLAMWIVSELGRDSTAYTDDSLDGVLVAYIMNRLSNRISREIANMNYIVDAKYNYSAAPANRLKEARIPASIGLMLDLIKKDLMKQIDYIRLKCFDPNLVAESLKLNGVEVAE